MARRYEAPVTIVHVWDPHYFSVPESFLLYDEGQLPPLVARIEQQLDLHKQQLLSAGVMQVKTRVLQGTPFAEIVRLAKAEHFDLVVMGTHGRAGFAHTLLGSVAERVVRTAPCAVLTVRHPEQHHESV
jgi:nucleotide-binding universal stress UspA family protein